MRWSPPGYCVSLAHSEPGTATVQQRHATEASTDLEITELVRCAHGKALREIFLVGSEDVDRVVAGRTEGLQARRTEIEAPQHQRWRERHRMEGNSRSARRSCHPGAGRHHRNAGREAAQRIAEGAAVERICGSRRIRTVTAITGGARQVRNIMGAVGGVAHRRNKGVVASSRNEGRDYPCPVRPVDLPHDPDQEFAPACLTGTASTVVTTCPGSRRATRTASGCRKSCCSRRRWQR